MLLAKVLHARYMVTRGRKHQAQTDFALQSAAAEERAVIDVATELASALASQVEGFDEARFLEVIRGTEDVLFPAAKTNH
jgi:hypothetical protein